VELLHILGDPKAPHITQLDLSMNTTLTWRCTRALSVALGAPASSEEGRPGEASDLKVGGGNALVFRVCFWHTLKPSVK